jgi:hypothetical protein
LVKILDAAIGGVLAVVVSITASGLVGSVVTGPDSAEVAAAAEAVELVSFEASAGVAFAVAFAVSADSVLAVDSAGFVGADGSGEGGVGSVLTGDFFCARCEAGSRSNLTLVVGSNSKSSKAASDGIDKASFNSSSTHCSRTRCKSSVIKRIAKVAQLRRKAGKLKGVAI